MTLSPHSIVLHHPVMLPDGTRIPSGTRAWYDPSSDRPFVFGREAEDASTLLTDEADEFLRS